jgi:predicted RNA polymerase sigma factor
MPSHEPPRRLGSRFGIRAGLDWLKHSADGDVFSRFHAEAGIAAEHCLAPSYEQTRWQEIADLYVTLERIAPSPLHTLNRAVAVAEWQGAEAGLDMLEGLAPPAGVSGSYLWDAVLGDLHRRAGHVELSRQHLERALGSAPTDAMRELLRRRFVALD